MGRDFTASLFLHDTLQIPNYIISEIFVQADPKFYSCKLIFLTNLYCVSSTSSSSNGYSTTRTDEAGTQNIFDDDQTKAQLMEALCHSQTRAREAEKAAKQAYTEKEHIITLFFRQASQLFAYKQWLRLLQLENLCLQLKNKNELFPSVLPWVPSKGRQMKKGQHRSGKRKHGKPGHELRKSVVAFALGLGLAGAGLLLGWTMGWLFPSG